MDKNIIKALAERSVLVKARLTAIKAEELGLIEENRSLDSLLYHYEKLEYDSIDEERRVTRALVKKANSKGIKKGKSKYDEIFKVIFSENKENGLSLTNLRRHVIDLTGVEVSAATIYNIIEAAVKYNKAKKENKLYFWNFDE